MAYAQGPMAHLVNGVMEQNTLAYVMAYSACIGPARKTQACYRRRVDGTSSPKSLDPWTTTQSNLPMEPQGDQPPLGDQSAEVVVTDNDIPTAAVIERKNPLENVAQKTYCSASYIAALAGVALIFASTSSVL